MAWRVGTPLVIDPIQPLRLYAGGNGMFRSTDGGKTWSPINNGLAARFSLLMVIDPLTPTTLYVATVDSFGTAPTAFIRVQTAAIAGTCAGTE